MIDRNKYYIYSEIKKLQKKKHSIQSIRGNPNHIGSNIRLKIEVDY